MIDPSFQGVNRLFVLSLQNNDDWTGHARYFIRTAEMKGDDYKNHCLLDYLYFKEHYKMIAINLSKQPAFDPDPKVIKQINLTGHIFFTRNRESIVNLFCFSIISI